ncbi:hypothetical protein ABLT32_12500 [Bacteroides pyogenes]|uniref:hypothetical protein n=1 Tax=Bacteroides pyogenes TaxID=310300 RepID=UPI004064C36C
MTEREVLFKLVRVAIGTENITGFDTDVNWESVYKLASQQEVLAIAFDEFNVLFNNEDLGKEELLFQRFFLCVGLENQNLLNVILSPDFKIFLS